MPLSEFQLIERFFRDAGAARGDVTLPIGDDAALIECPADRTLVAAIDTLVEGVHFPRGSPARSIGHRSLAVNLSDLAAMGAEPAWALLALTLPRADEQWLADFSRGFAALAREHGVALVGGDTTSGPLCVTVQILGLIEAHTALTRSGGKPGDLLFVSGTPGDAAAGLQLEQGRMRLADEVIAGELTARFRFPTPRIALGRRLREFASACIDVSDGLLGDAGKLAHASGCAAMLDLERLPISTALGAALGERRAREIALTGGDDYELCFAGPAARQPALRAALPPDDWGYRQIGKLSEGSGARVRERGTVIEFSHSGFDHFHE